MVEGVDYGFSPIPSAEDLKAAGKAFAVRYGGPGSDDKHLHAAELAALTAAGIAVVANAEGTTGGLLGGYAVGRSWAADADVYFRQLGMPADRPIYLSVDLDAGSADWPALDAAMEGAASVIGRERVGVYGGYRTIQHFASNGLARWLWQTYAWSGSPTMWHPAAHIQQYRNRVIIGGADCDLNRAMAADFGQWTLGDGMEPVQVWTDVKWGTQSAADRLLLASQSAKPADITAAVSPLNSKLDGLVTTIQALSAALAAGGTDIDTAAILKRIDDRAAEDAARDAAHANVVAALQAEIHDLETKLAAAAQAQAAALN